MIGALLKVGSMASSVGLYITATGLQKGLALVRMFVFLYLLSAAPQEYGLWSLGAMVIGLASPLVTLGANHALARYVPAFEARGRLREFFARSAWRIGAIAIAAAAMAWALAEPITRALLASQVSVPGVSFELELLICRWAIINALLLALLTNVLGFAGGMRAYRLVAALEILFNGLFLVLGPAALLAQRSAVALLQAHAVCVLVALAAGVTLLTAAVRRTHAAPAAQSPPLISPPPDEPAPVAAPQPHRPLGDVRWSRMLAFAVVAMVGLLMWRLTGYVSFYLTNRHMGSAAGGVFNAYVLLAQPVAYLAAAVWTVVAAHLARRWEGDQRERALELLQTSYNAVSLALMTLTVLLYATSAWWTSLLPASYAGRSDLLGGLLLASQATSQLAVVTLLAQLRERPSASVAVAMAGAALNYALAIWWLPQYGQQGAAWAAGVGLYAGGTAAAAVCLALLRCRLKAGTYAMLVAPGVLLLGPVWSAVAWGVLLAAALTTGAVFDRHEKTALLTYLRRKRTT
jgi:O-antigen/teichoic acid export membrane protein